MAKRKRLLPARGTSSADAADEPLVGRAPEMKGMFPVAAALSVDTQDGPRDRRVPISHVAGDAATTAALRDLADEMRASRDEGRLVQMLRLESIDADHLVRDRMAVDADELEVLVKSLRARGQQTPIEVVALESGRYGLISGWRRLTALRHLHAETGETRFGRVQALLRRPQDAPAAYLAMVEENEIRVGLSYYERARIVARATELGVFPDETAGLRGLFASASRAKRSKIGSFLPICRALDSALRYPTAIPERLGLALSKALGADPDLARSLADRLRQTATGSAAEEIALLDHAARGGASSRKKTLTAGTDTVSTRDQPTLANFGGVRLSCGPDGLTLSGPGVDAAFRAELETWLKRRE